MDYESQTPWLFKPLFVNFCYGGEVSLFAQTCDPPTAVSVSSITSTTATVNWTPYGGASFTWVHYKVQGAGSESTVSVAGSSYQLTGLLPCHTYEVRLRSACGSIFTSAFTSTETFETESSDPSVEVTVDDAYNPCYKRVSATSGFVRYDWTDGVTTKTDFGKEILITRPANYTVIVYDANGCTAEKSFNISAYSGACITNSYDATVESAMKADSTTLKSDIQLLSKGLAGVMNNSTVKSFVKSIAINQVDANKKYFVSLQELSDSCEAHSVNIKNLMKTALWNNGANATDTARIASIYKIRNVTGVSPTAKLYPTIYFSYLNPDFQNSGYSSWDSVSADYVAASGYHGSGDKTVYSLGGGTISNTTLNWSQFDKEMPVWQVFMFTDFLCGGKTKTYETTGIVNGNCRCDEGIKGPDNSSVGCSQSNCGGTGCPSQGTYGQGGCTGNCLQQFVPSMD